MTRKNDLFSVVALGVTLVATITFLYATLPGVH